MTAGLAARISLAGIQLTTLTTHSHLKIADNAFAFDNVFAFGNADDAFVLILTMHLHLIMHSHLTMQLHLIMLTIHSHQWRIQDLCM